MKRTLSIVCHPNDFTGHGNHACQVIRLLPVLLDMDIVVRPTARGNFPADIAQLIKPGENDAEWEIILGPPNIQPTAKKRTIYMTTCESTRLSVQAIQMINSAEIVIAPSQWCATVFNACGVNRPIYVVPLGFDKQFTYQPMPKGDPFTFACAGQLSNGAHRKGIQRIIDLFLKAFPKENVRLNVKVMPNDVVCARDDNRIAVPRMFLNNEEVAHWLSRCNCFINLATEGFGLWPLQAMAIGRPVISPMYGGVTEYLRPALTVEHRLVSAKDSWHGLGLWAEADEDLMIAAMRYAANPDNHEAVSWIGHKAFWNTRQYTWENSINKLAVILREETKLAVPQALISMQRTPDDRAWEKWRAGAYAEPNWSQQCESNGWKHGTFDFGQREPDIVRFNPGLCRSPDGKKLILFPRRARFANGDRVSNHIEQWTVAEDMTVSECRPLELGPGNQEDARAVVHNSQINLCYVQVDGPGSAASQRIALLNNNEKPIVLPKINFGGNGDGKTWQKNWSPFVSQARLCFIYNENEILNSCLTPWMTAVKHGFDWSVWKYGIPRGGTPPIRINNEWVTFFHSSMPWLRGQVRNWYWWGAYAFDAKPPFRITKLTINPLMTGCPNKPDRIVPHALQFPCGAVVDGDDFLISMGVNDDFAAWCRIPVTQLFERMKTV